MKRLTKTYKDGTYGVADDLDVAENNHDFKNLLIQRLGFFEDPQDEKETKTAWGDPVPPKFNRCAAYDVLTLKAAIEKGTTSLEWEEIQAIMSLQIAMYQLLLEKQNITINYSPGYYFVTEEDQCLPEAMRHLQGDMRPTKPGTNN